MMTICDNVRRGFMRHVCARAQCVLLVGAVSFVLSVSLSAPVHKPVSCSRDEFNDHLAAGTFAHGRLSNLTHPLSVQFASMPMIHQLTYASKYPPAQGLAPISAHLVGGQRLAEYGARACNASPDAGGSAAVTLGTPERATNGPKSNSLRLEPEQLVRIGCGHGRRSLVRATPTDLRKEHVS